MIESNSDLHRLAAEYAKRMPAEDEASLRTLAALCDRMQPLQELADRLTQLPAPETDEAIAMILAVQYAIQAVLRTGRCLVISTAASADRA